MSDTTLKSSAPAPLRRKSMPSRTTQVLMLCQALYYACVSIDLTLTAIVGLSLAPSVALATVPLAMITIVGTLGSVLAGLAVARFGYPAVMMAGAIAGVAGGALSVTAVCLDSFLLLCIGTGVVGLYRATGGYIRFMAADLAPPGGRERALSYILAGGLLAAFAGPWIATSTENLFTVDYAGSYAMVSVMCLATLPLLLVIGGAKSRQAAITGPVEPGDASSTAKPLRVSEIANRGDFLTALLTLGVAGAAMTMIMAVGPLGSEHQGHSMSMSAAIIQWHLVGMFAPSLFSGALMDKWGKRNIALIGTILLCAGTVAGSLGSGFINFLSSLLLNGIGWNFLFVAGSAYLVSCYPPGRGGRLQAIAEGVGSGAAVAASLAASIVFYSLGWEGTNLLALGLGVALGLWLLVGARKSRSSPAAKA